MQASQSMALVRAMRQSNSFGSFMLGSCQLATRRENPYPNMRVKKIKYKNMAREKRKERIRLQRAENAGQGSEKKEEIPPFFLPARYKLLFNLVADMRNAHRVGRKPIPENLKKEFAAHAKEYAEYKQAQRLRMKQEELDHIRVQKNVLESLFQLPDYLMAEATSETGASVSDEMQEFMPAILYMEQLLRVLPREISCKYRMIPAFEESLMR